MRILDRYLLREFVRPFLTGVLAFSLLFVLFDLFDRMGRFLNVSAPPLSVMAYYFHYLFAFNGNLSLITVIMPIALLLAALYCASNMIRHNEFVAMMAGGISFTRILLPFASVGLAASLLALAAQELQASRSSQWMKRYEKSVLKKEPLPSTIKNFAYMNTADHRLWQIPEFSPTNRFHLGTVKVTQINPDRSETIYFTGSAYWADGTWWLRSPLIERKNPDGALIGEAEFRPKESMEMRDWTEAPTDFAIEHAITTEVAGGRNTAAWQDLSARDIRAYLGNHPDFPRGKRVIIETDYHARFATPFTCLIVALIGVPAGLKSGRSNVMTRILLSLALFFLFFFFLQISLYLGKVQALPPLLAAWLPNLLFTALGVRMIGKLT